MRPREAAVIRLADRRRPAADTTALVVPTTTGLALRDGVPEELRTLVAVPVMLNSRAAVEKHLHNLEIHYLASPDAPAVDVYVAGTATPLIEDLAYGETSAYVDVDAADGLEVPERLAQPPGQDHGFRHGRNPIDDHRRRSTRFPRTRGTLPDMDGAGDGAGAGVDGAPDDAALSAGAFLSPTIFDAWNSAIAA